MKLVVDANVVVSALVADSKTRELIVTLDFDLLTPKFVHDEIENHTELIVEKSGMRPARVAQFLAVPNSGERVRDTALDFSDLPHAESVDSRVTVS